MIRVPRYKLAELDIMRGSYWLIPIRNDTRIYEEAHQEVGFYIKVLVKEAQRVCNRLNDGQRIKSITFAKWDRIKAILDDELAMDEL
ncbi:hypothetical protein Tco_1097396 [Tanacetum coccineum]